MRSRKYPSTLQRDSGQASLRTGPGRAGARLREWLATWLGVGKAQRLRAETRTEALTTAYRHKLVTELHNLKILDVARPFDKAQDRPFDKAQDRPFDKAQDRPFDLETSYVPLRLSLRGPFGHAQGFGSGQALQVREYNRREEPAGHVGEGKVVQSKDRAMSPEEALLQFRHLTVLGDPGAGKTTMLRYLTFLAASPPSSTPRVGGAKGRALPDFPILVSLGRFAAAPQFNLLDFVISEIETRYGFSELRPDGSTGSPRGPVEGLRPHLEERLEKGSVLFLLDGLDEANVAPPFSSPPRMGGIEGGAEATYRHVVGQINVLAARYPNCPMVVTARRGSWKGLLAASFHTLEVLEFSRGDIQRFIVNWFGPESDRARDFKDALSQNPWIRALAANPLLLSLMAFAFEQDGELPEGRAGLYRRSIELLLSAVDGENLTGTEHKIGLLEEVALHFHLRRVFLFPEDELREVIASYLPAVDIPANQVATVPSAEFTLGRVEGLRTGLEEISGQNGLLQEQIVGWYGFPHPTCQEYLAAAAISKSAVLSLSKGGQIELALEGLHDPWWEGTTLFLAEVLEDATLLLESILAQEEDIFHSNLLLAGRCLAACGLEPTRRPERVGLDIIEGLKRLIEGGYHWLLQHQAVSVLAEIGGGAVVSFFVALLRRGEIDPHVLAKVAQVLGSLHPFDSAQGRPFDGVYPEQSQRAQDRDKSVIPDLLAFLTDEKLDLSVRGNIAEALGSLGACPERSRRDESVIPPLLALLPDETVDPSVRGRIAEALVTLGGESIISSLLALLPNEGIDPYVRERITEVLASLGDDRTSWQPFDLAQDKLRAGFAQDKLVPLLPDEKIHPSVRRGVAEALGSLGDESAIPDLLALLSDEKVDSAVRGKVAETLGTLGAESVIPPLLATLSDEKVNYSVRMTITEVLGALGDKSIAPQFLAFLSDEKIDPDVRASIAGTLGVLGEKSVIPQLLSLLPDEKIDPAVRWRIVDALSSLSDKTIASHLRALLPDEKIDSSVRWTVAEALDALAGEGEEKKEVTENGDWRLDDRSRVPQFLALLKDERIDPSVSVRIIEALGTLGGDRATVEGLAALLDREDIGSHVYEALFHVSQRAGMRVFARQGRGYEVRPTF